jgi:integrase
MSITIKSVSALEPGKVVWDSAVKGFGCRRQRNRATYFLKLRDQGRQRLLTIGPHGSPWTPETARREAKRLLGLVASGKDPRVGGKTALGALVEDYLPYAKRRQKPRSYIETARHLVTDCAALHKASIFKLTRRHVAEHLAALEAEKGPVTAIHTRAALSAMFNWAIGQGIELASNPVSGTNKPSEPPSRARVLGDAELAKVWHALPADAFGDIIRLLILTGSRREEIGGPRWDEVDLARGTITLPPARTKNSREHVVPLAPVAIEILSRRPRLGNWVFGPGGQRRYASWSDPKVALDARAEIADWRIHDLRRSVATGMATLGVLPHVIEQCLNHVTGTRSAISRVYNRATYLDEVRTALERWAGHVAELAGWPGTRIRGVGASSAPIN